MPNEDEELVHELLFGIPGPRGRTFPAPGSRRELRARIILARLMVTEAPNGFYTRAVAALIRPPRRSAIITGKVIFRRLSRGRPAVVGDRRNIEIATFLHAELKRRREKGASTDAQSRNLKPAIDEAKKKFGVRRSTIMKIWQEFRPQKRRSAESK